MTSTRRELGGVTMTCEVSPAACKAGVRSVETSFEARGGVVGLLDRGGVAGFQFCAVLTAAEGGGLEGNLRFRVSGDVGADERLKFRRASSSGIGIGIR